MEKKKLSIDTRKLLGFRLDAKGRSGAKVGSKAGAKAGRKA